jgi:hypothetical protein
LLTLRAVTALGGRPNTRVRPAYRVPRISPGRRISTSTNGLPHSGHFEESTSPVSS